MNVMVLFSICFGGLNVVAAGDSAAMPPSGAVSLAPTYSASIITTQQSKSAKKSGIRWQPVIGQAAMLFSLSEGFRIATQEDTRESLKGPYFRNYITSLRGLGGWGDDDPAIANYVAHPMQGSTTMWILIHNDPKGEQEVFGLRNRSYWISRFKGVAFSAAYSTFYEIGPVGDAAIGNLGMNPEYKGAVDLVVTPTVGMGWHLTEDILDKYLIQWVERKTGNVWINLLTRSWLNPTRSLANMLRFQVPWRRDTRDGILAIRAEHHRRDIAHRR
jgi:hypothetical protein